MTDRLLGTTVMINSLSPDTTYGTFTAMTFGYLYDKGGLEVFRSFFWNTLPVNTRVKACYFHGYVGSIWPSGLVSGTFARVIPTFYAEGYVTWNDVFKPTLPWTSPGCSAVEFDYSLTPTPVPFTVSAENAWADPIDITSLAVDAMENRSRVLSVRIRGDVETGGPGTGLYSGFRSDDHATVATRPYLEITEYDGTSLMIPLVMN